MSMTVACPGCATQLTVAPELVGQVLVCPHCASQFQVSGGAAPTPPAASVPSPPQAKSPAWRGDPGVLATGFKLTESPAPQPQQAVPRFKPLDPAAQATSITQDGKLPELSLADARQPPKTAAPAEKPQKTMTLTIVVAASLMLSILLSFTDFSSQGTGANKREEARYQIVSFYGHAEGALEPYQLLLRDAQRAHSRGDHATEQANYREVLRLLRAENRSTSLTETRDGDQQLEEAISIVLAGE
ncbi:MAG TPA: hypothetical protein VFI31_20325 [Pirellulales bacterium]|nr:hypothetical protein [Pirellulales bacterium]